MSVVRGVAHGMPSAPHGPEKKRGSFRVETRRERLRKGAYELSILVNGLEKNLFTRNIKLSFTLLYPVVSMDHGLVRKPGNSLVFHVKTLQKLLAVCFSSWDKATPELLRKWFAEASSALTRAFLFQAESHFLCMLHVCLG